MNKKNTQLEQLALLRLQGLSFDEISAKINVHKTTLIDWAKDLNLTEQIRKNQYLKIEALVKQYQLTNEHRIKRQITLLKKCYDEIEKRDLSELPTDKLFNLITTLTEQIKANVPKVTIYDETTQFLEVQTFVEKYNSTTFDPTE